MRKRGISLVLALIMILGMLPVISFAADTTPTFYIAANADAGLSGNVNVIISSTAGSIYLPGTADASKLYLSWTSSSSVSVTYNKKNYTTSGTVPIPAAGSSGSYSIKVGSATKATTYTITTYKSSTAVEAMFLNIDESYVDDEGAHTIKMMNEDGNHESVCYGNLSFEGASYDMSVKGRGNWTWFNVSSTSKKPYNITIYKAADEAKGIAQYDKKNSVEFIEGITSKKWSLLANYADSSLMKNKVGYDLACALGIGIESRYVDLWINGAYKGNYMMTPKNDYNAPDDGYALELDNNFDTEDPFFALKGLDPALTSENVFTVKAVGDNAAATGLKTEDIQSWMQTMLNAVLDTSSSKYLDYIDLDSWAKFYLLEELYKNHDIVCGSFLMHRDGLSASDKLIAGPVWDLDNTLGGKFTSNKIGLSDTEQKRADGWYIDAVNGCTAFLQLLGKHADFMARVYEIYNDYYDAFTGVLTEIDTLSTEIAASAEMNFKVWNVNQYEYNSARVTSTTTFGSGTYAYKKEATSTWKNYVNNVRYFLEARLKFFKDTLTVAAPAVPTVSGSSTYDVFSTITLTANGTADAYRWQSSADGVTWKDIDGATGKTYTTTALTPLNGTQLRCVAIKKGTTTIATTTCGKTVSQNVSYSEPVILTINQGTHTHKYSETVTPSTCLAKGYTTYTCSCGDTYTGKSTKKSGHAFSEGSCTLCGETDHSYIPDCKHDVTTTLTAGTWVLYLNGTRMGEFTFASAGTSKWTIKASNGTYLAIENKIFVYSKDAYSWTFSGNKFSGSGYYLSYLHEHFCAPTTSSSLYSDAACTASFAKVVTESSHKFSAFASGEDGTHSRTCSTCSYVNTFNCEYTTYASTGVGTHTGKCGTCSYVSEGTCKYDKTTHRCVCGNTDPDSAFTEKADDNFHRTWDGTTWVVGAHTFALSDTNLVCSVCGLSKEATVQKRTVTVKALEKTDSSVTVLSKASGGGLTEIWKTVEVQSAGDVTVVEAPGISNRKFSYWASDAQGKNVLSKSLNYVLAVRSNITVYAVYTERELPSSGTTAAVAVTSKFATFTEDSNKTLCPTLSFTWTWNSNTAITSTGIIIVNDSALGALAPTIENLKTFLGDTYYDVKATTNSKAGDYTLRQQVSNGDNNVYVLPYVVVSGQTIWGTEVTTATYNSLLESIDSMTQVTDIFRTISTSNTNAIAFTQCYAITSGTVKEIGMYYGLAEFTTAQTASQYKITSDYTKKNGDLTLIVPVGSHTDAKIYVLPYVELTDGTFIYGSLVNASYNGIN